MLNLFLILYKVEEKYFSVTTDRGDVFISPLIYTESLFVPGATHKGGPGKPKIFL